MTYLSVSLISFILSALAVGYGAAHLAKKRGALYFLLLICAIACYAMQELFSIVNILCSGPENPVNAGILGVLGADCFMLSANFGQLDALVDDGSDANRRAKKLAFIAPAVLLLCLCANLFLFERVYGTAVLVLILLSVPAIPASYYSLKHLLLPEDELGLLRATRGCNAAILLYFAVSSFYIFGLGFGAEAVMFWGEIALAIPLLLLAAAAVKGAEAWKT